MESDNDKVPDLKFNDPQETDKGKQCEIQTESAICGVMAPTGSDSESDSDQSDSEYKCDVCDKKFSGFTPFMQHEKSSKHAKAILKKKRAKKLLDKITKAEKGSEVDEECLSFVKEPYAVCKACNKQFGNASSYHLHVISKAHKKKILEASILDQVKENGKINIQKLKDLYARKKKSDKGDDDLIQDIQERLKSMKVTDSDEDVTETFECEDCQKSFSGMIPYTQHMLSKTHAKIVEKKNLLEKIIPAITHRPSECQDVSTLLVEDDVLVCKLCSVSFSGPENALTHVKSRKHKKNLEEWTRKEQRKQKHDPAAAAASLRRDSESGDTSSDASEVEENSVAKTEVKNFGSNLDQTEISTNNEDVISPGLECADGANPNESLTLYSKYKKYKEIINSVMGDK